MLKQKYFLTDFFILSAEKQPIKSSWRKIEWLLDVGQKDRAVGDLYKGVTNLSLFCKYIIGTDKFSDERCLECKLLPICNGGCSRYRFGDDYKTTDQCPLNESEIINFMV